MNKKIGVITINDFNNYGNRLQCYAVQHSLQSMGYIVENIYNSYTPDGYLTVKAKRLFHLLCGLPYQKQIALRTKNFLKFNENIIFSKSRIINGHYDTCLSKEYDYFVVGSDQVWNPLDCGISEVDFLTFAEEEKRIAFSASMGVNILPEHAVDVYRQRLNTFRSISVREDAAKCIIEDLTGRTDIEVLVDPTMLLRAEEWEQLAQKPDIPHQPKYILTYFLGGIGIWKDVIDSLAQKYSCEVIDIYDRKSAFYTCGPQHFLYLEKNAFLVCTDSFHSTVFAFLLNRPFIVFDRNRTEINMNSRIDTFLSKFGLQHHKYSPEQDLDRCLTWDYTDGYQQLEREREKAKQFIRQALS